MPSTPILVPVDFSDCSVDVIEEAADIARRYDAELVLLHVVERFHRVQLDRCVTLPVDGATRRASIGGHLRRFAADRFQMLVEHASDCGVPATHLLEEGDAADVIAAVADRLDALMIVMGTHGRRGPAYAVRRSVAAAVGRRASCPVMSIRFQPKPTCDEICMWCDSGVIGLRSAISEALETNAEE